MKKKELKEILKQDKKTIILLKNLKEYMIS